jgi:hypothetical protein
MTSKHWRRFMFLVGMGCLHEIAPAQAQELPPIQTLELKGFFALPLEGNLKPLAVKSIGPCCWYFLSAPNYIQAVKINSAGLRVATFALASPVAFVAGACASEGGQLAVLHWNRQIAVYSSAGALSGTFQVSKETGDCIFDGETLFSRTAHGFRPLEDESQKALVPGQLLAWPTGSFPMGRHRLAVVEMVEAVLNVVDTTTGEWQRYQLVAPEIQGIKRPPRTDYTAMPTFFAVTADSSTGDFYAGVAPYNLTRGVTILKFDQRGNLVARFRGALPNSPDYITRSNTNGHFMVTQIAVADDKLLLISSIQNRAAYFSLK